MLIIETTVNTRLRALVLRTAVSASTPYYRDPATKHELIERNTFSFSRIISLNTNPGCRVHSHTAISRALAPTPQSLTPPGSEGQGSRHRKRHRSGQMPQMMRQHQSRRTTKTRRMRTKNRHSILDLCGPTSRCIHLSSFYTVKIVTKSSAPDA